MQIDNLMNYHYSAPNIDAKVNPDIASQISEISKMNIERQAGHLISHYKVIANLLKLTKK